MINIPSLSFIDKVEILKKYIFDIRIYYYGNNYYLEVFFNIINMESVVFLIDDKYKYAFTLPKNQDYDNDLDNKIYIIKGNLDKDINTQEFQVNILTLYTRFLQFNILKQSYKFNSIKQSI